MAYIEIQLSDNEGWDDPETMAPKVRIEVPCDIEHIDDVWGTLIRPALRACGFHADTIDGLFKDGGKS